MALNPEDYAENTPNVLTEGIEPYPPLLRARHSQRLIRLNDAKQLLRDASAQIDADFPRWWQISVGHALDFAGNAILGFASGLKANVFKAKIGDGLLRIFGGPNPFLAELARNYAAFFGVRTTIGNSLWQATVSAVKPNADKLAKGSIYLGFSLSSLERMRRLLEGATVGPDHTLSGPHLGAAERRLALPQRGRKMYGAGGNIIFQPDVRVRKKVRSRKGGKRRRR